MPGLAPVDGAAEYVEAHVLHVEVVDSIAPVPEPPSGIAARREQMAGVEEEAEVAGWAELDALVPASATDASTSSGAGTFGSTPTVISKAP